MLFGAVCLLSLWMLFSPGDATPDVSVNDKLVHATLFAALAVTGLLARLPLVPLAAGLASYALVSEVLQAVLPIQRDGDWHDALADGIGIALGIAVVGLARRRGASAGTRPGS